MLPPRTLPWKPNEADPQASQAMHVCSLATPSALKSLHTSGHVLFLLFAGDDGPESGAPIVGRTRRERCSSRVRPFLRLALPGSLNKPARGSMRLRAQDRHKTVQTVPSVGKTREARVTGSCQARRFTQISPIRSTTEASANTWGRQEARRRRRTQVHPLCMAGRGVRGGAHQVRRAAGRLSAHRPVLVSATS